MANSICASCCSGNRWQTESQMDGAAGAFADGCSETDRALQHDPLVDATGPKRKRVDRQKLSPWPPGQQTGVGACKPRSVSKCRQWLWKRCFGSCSQLRSHKASIQTLLSNVKYCRRVHHPREPGYIASHRNEVLSLWPNRLGSCLRLRTSWILFLLWLWRWQTSEERGRRRKQRILKLWGWYWILCFLPSSSDWWRPSQVQQQAQRPLASAENWQQRGVINLVEDDDNDGAVPMSPDPPAVPGPLGPCLPRRLLHSLALMLSRPCPL